MYTTLRSPDFHTYALLAAHSAAAAAVASAAAEFSGGA